MMYLPILDTLKLTRRTYQAQLHPDRKIGLYWLLDLFLFGHIELTSWQTIWIANYHRQYEAQKIAELNASIEAFNAS